MSDLHELTATEQLAQLAGGAVSSRELTEHYLDRIERLDGELRSFVTVTSDVALAEADAADARRARGGAAGLLDGLPLAFKDMHPTAGVRTTLGSRALAAWVPDQDGPAVGALRRAGAVLVGKTNVPELGPTCYTDSAVGGCTPTPYDLGLSASGSSGGSAAAVAAGLAPAAHGSDGLGSLRTPAANCGLIGFKPSRGRVPGSGAGWLAMATEGPLGRTAQDVALLLDAFGGPGDSDLWRLPAAEDGANQRACTEAHRLTRLRVGVLHEPGFGASVDPGCRAAAERAALTLWERGHHVEEVPSARVPGTADLGRALVVTVAASVLAGVRQLLPDGSGRDVLMPFTRWLCETGEEVSAADLLQAHAVLAAAAQQHLALLRDYDVVLTPTTTAPPLTTEALRADDAAESVRTMLAWSAFTPWANLSGACAVSVPVHLTEGGLPLGAQLAARPGADTLLVGLAQQLEEQLGWPAVHPPAWTA